MLWGDQERWPEVRARLAEYFLEQWQDGAPWTLDDRYTRLFRVNADGEFTQLMECTPEEYAADLLDPDHPGTDADWHIAARAFNINFVVVHNEQVEGREEFQFVRFPVQKSDQRNMVGSICSRPVCECDTEGVDFFSLLSGWIR